jgi:hypothetical protein
LFLLYLFFFKRELEGLLSRQSTFSSCLPLIQLAGIKLFIQGRRYPLSNHQGDKWIKGRTSIGFK